jgi:hypothetical protein
MKKNGSVAQNQGTTIATKRVDPATKGVNERIKSQSKHYKFKDVPSGNCDSIRNKCFVKLLRIIPGPSDSIKETGALNNVFKHRSCKDTDFLSQMTEKNHPRKSTPLNIKKRTIQEYSSCEKPVDTDKEFTTSKGSKLNQFNQPNIYSNQ